MKQCWIKYVKNPPVYCNGTAIRIVLTPRIRILTQNQCVWAKEHTYILYKHKAEPVFLNLLRSPGIDSQPGGPVQQPYLSYWPVRQHRLTESIPRNRFLGSLDVYKYLGNECAPLRVSNDIVEDPHLTGVVETTHLLTDAGICRLHLYTDVVFYPACWKSSYLLIDSRHSTVFPSDPVPIYM